MSSDLETGVLAEGEDVDRELDDFFEACPQSFAQQTTGWRDVILAIGEDEPMLLGARRQGRLVGVLPAYRFEGPLGAILNSVPQAGPLGGVACHPGADPATVYASLLAAYLELARGRGCAFASVIGNPLWPDAEHYERFFQPDFVLRNSCQVLDLEVGLDAGGEPLAPGDNLRRNLRKAANSALRIDEEQSHANVTEWYAIHVERHAEIGAKALPEAMFRAALERMVPRGKARFFFVRRVDSGEMIAGGFYVYHGSVIDALMPAVRSDQAQLAPNYLLALHSMRFARARGIRWYNWQGSPPTGGVARFKRQWGSSDVPYAYYTRITGDAQPFFDSEPHAIAEAYRWHFVLPFDRVGRNRAPDGGTSTRAAAWKSLESNG